MLVHPFNQSVWHKIIGISLVIILITILSVPLALFGNILPATAIIDSALYIGLLALAGYYYWYIISFVPILQTQIIIALLVQIICLAISFALLYLFELEETSEYMKLIPLRVVPAILSWTILMMWYHILLINRTPIDNEINEARNEAANETSELQVEALDRISVKDGAKIHIVKVNELMYVQAYGDYVMLFTNEGKYVKEQTMKYLEQHLPSSFIRIHRSYIVNTDYIVRIELFGKDTYQMRLKNGAQLRISLSGYKLLKDKLLI